MLDPGTDLVPPQSSPTISSVSSSSDLESASTGSFFHDRSTTLGTLMGVTTFTFNAIRETAPTLNENPDEDENRTKRLPKRRRRWWWGLCGDESVGIGVGASRRRSSASLAEFLEVERRLGEVLYGDGDQLEELVNSTRGGERVLFEDGRVLPPMDNNRGINHESGSNGVGVFRFPGYMSGLCNRGVG